MLYKINFLLMIILVGIISISCMSKNNSDKTSQIKEMNGNYSLEYTLKIEGTNANYIQSGKVSPWKIVQEENKIVVEEVAVGDIKNSKVQFIGGPLNFGAGYGKIKFNGIATDSTIVGTSSGTYYDNKLGTGKFSSASFIFRKIR